MNKSSWFWWPFGQLVFSRKLTNPLYFQQRSSSRWVIISTVSVCWMFCFLLLLAQNQLVTLAPQGIAASILFISMASSIYLAFSFQLLLLLLGKGITGFGWIWFFLAVHSEEVTESILFVISLNIYERFETDNGTTPFKDLAITNEYVFRPLQVSIH